MKNDILFWVILGLVPLILYYLMVRRTREQERARAAAKAADPANAPVVMARFRKIRSMCAWFSLLPIMLGMAIAALAAAGNKGCSVYREFFGVPDVGWFLVGMGVAAFGIVFTTLVYRCPVCKCVPMESDGWVNLNPDFCPSCKTRLK
jgi:hypothetical protein